jgi:small-conductance mechanosensitive channel
MSNIVTEILVFLRVISVVDKKHDSVIGNPYNPLFWIFTILAIIIFVPFCSVYYACSRRFTEYIHEIESLFYTIYYFDIKIQRKQYVYHREKNRKEKLNDKRN